MADFNGECYKERKIFPSHLFLTMSRSFENAMLACFGLSCVVQCPVYTKGVKDLSTCRHTCAVCVCVCGCGRDVHWMKESSIFGAPQLKLSSNFFVHKWKVNFFCLSKSRIVKQIVKLCVCVSSCLQLNTEGQRGSAHEQCYWGYDVKKSLSLAEVG